MHALGRLQETNTCCIVLHFLLVSEVHDAPTPNHRRPIQGLYLVNWHLKFLSRRITGTRSPWTLEVVVDLNLVAYSIASFSGFGLCTAVILDSLFFKSIRGSIKFPPPFHLIWYILQVENALKAQPGIHDNFTAAVSHFLKIVHTMDQRCSASLEVYILN